MLCRARVAAAGGRKLVPGCPPGGGLARRATVPQQPPRREAPMPGQVSSTTIEAYRPLEIDKVVSNVICQIQFP